MKIVDSKPTSVPFKDISYGEVFKDAYGNYYMKITPALLSDGKSFINHVRLIDGGVYFARDDMTFEVVDCKLDHDLLELKSVKDEKPEKTKKESSINWGWYIAYLLMLILNGLIGRARGYDVLTW